MPVKLIFLIVLLASCVGSNKPKKSYSNQVDTIRHEKIYLVDKKGLPGVEVAIGETRQVFSTGDLDISVTRVDQDRYMVQHQEKIVREKQTEFVPTKHIDKSKTVNKTKTVTKIQDNDKTKTVTKTKVKTPIPFWVWIVIVVVAGLLAMRIVNKIKNGI